MKRLISICCPSNRTFLWKALYAVMKEHSEDVDFELLFVGPEVADFELPVEVKHIKTGNIKRPQCDEVAIRQSQGDLLLFIGDDHRYDGGGLDHLYREYERLCEKKGDNKVVVLPNMRDRGSGLQRLRYGKRKTPPFASLHSALLHKDLIAVAGGGADIRFLGVYWDCDFALRLQLAGVEFTQYTGICCIEFAHPKIKTRHHRICKNFDKEVLNSFWIRKLAENEKPNPEEVWNYMPDRSFILSKRRLREFVGYKDENLLTLSQGPKSIGDIAWD